MFIYQKNGALNIMLEGQLPAAEGVTPDIVITADQEGKASVLVNGKEVEVASEEAGEGTEETSNTTEEPGEATEETGGEG